MILLAVIVMVFMATVCHAEFEAVQQACASDHYARGCRSVKCEECTLNTLCVCPVDKSEELAKVKAELKIEEEKTDSLVADLRKCEHPKRLKDECSKLGNEGVFSSESGKCYVNYDLSKGLNWTDSWNECQSKQFGGVRGRLAQPKTKHELALVKKTSIPYRAYSYWVGARAKDMDIYNGKFYWVTENDGVTNRPTDEEVDKEMLHDGQPNFFGQETCVYYYLEWTGLQDYRCDDLEEELLCQFEI